MLNDKPVFGMDYLDRSRQTLSRLCFKFKFAFLNLKIALSLHYLFFYSTVNSISNECFPYYNLQQQQQNVESPPQKIFEK